MSTVIIERRDLIKNTEKRTIGNTLDNKEDSKQESNHPMVSIDDGYENTYQIDYICYNRKWFMVAPESDQKRLTREWDEREI